MLSGLLTLLFLGIAGLVAVTVLMTIVGIVFSIAFGVVGFLLFKVAPVLLIGYCVLKFIERRRDPARKRLSVADQRWLDS